MTQIYYRSLTNVYSSVYTPKTPAAYTMENEYQLLPKFQFFYVEGDAKVNQEGLCLANW